MSLYSLISPPTEILIVKPALWQEYGNAKGNPGNLRECKYPEAF